VCSVRVLEGYVSLVCVLDRLLVDREMLGESLDVSCVHSVYDVFLA
jgi:hypothetical protein